MKNYGILGYGVEYEKIEKYLNRSRLIDVVYNWELTEDEGTDMTNIELLEKAIDDIMQSYEKDKLNERKFEIIELLETNIEDGQKRDLEKELSNIIIRLAKIK